MADIKALPRTEKIEPIMEKPLVDSEKLKQSLEHLAESESAKSVEQIERAGFKDIDQLKQAAPAATLPPVGMMAPQAKQQKQIEKVLAEGLEEIYLSLTPEKQKEFKIAGEETAKKINQLLAKAKVKIGDIIKLIKKWLSIIPGLNSYFLEQEAKIKADEILKMKNGNK